MELTVLLLTNCGLLITQNRNIKESQAAFVDSTANRESTTVDSVPGDDVESGTDSPRQARRSKKSKVKVDEQLEHKILTSTESLNVQKENSHFFVLNISL